MQLPAPWLSVLFAGVLGGFGFLTATSPASCVLLLSFPTLRSQLSVFCFLIWGWGSCREEEGVREGVRRQRGKEE